MHRAFISFACFLFSTIIVLADDLDRAIAAYHGGQYQEAISLFTPLAEAGVPRAQTALAHIYANGEGSPVDYKAAFHWAQRAAEAGDAAGQALLGIYYLEGRSTAVNEKQAAHWLGLAAAQDQPVALHNLGMMLLMGMGVEADEAEAVRLLDRAGQLGEGDAFYVLGNFYLQKALMSGDVDPGLQYFVQAALKGHRVAMATLGYLLEDFPEVENYRLKSAFQYRTAIIAGCTDLDEAAARAVAALSPEELVQLEESLAFWLPKLEPQIHDRNPVAGTCLS